MDEIEILLQDSESGIIYDLSSATESGVTIESHRMNGASKASLSYVDDQLMISNGSILRIVYNGTGIFYGYVFKSTTKSPGIPGVVAYDQLRYFKNKDTFIMKNHTASDLIRHICSRFGLVIGEIANTEFILPNKIYDNKSLLDMSYESIRDTLVGTGKMYILYDDFGRVSLSDADKLRVPIIVGDGSLATGFDYEKSIDEETYNKIKLYQDNKDTKTREYYITQDSNNISKWGVLQYHEKVDESMNLSQIANKGKDLLKLYNREKKRLSIPAIGDIRVRGGSGVMVDIQQIGVKQWCLVNKVTHQFKKGIHTMNLEVEL